MEQVLPGLDVEDPFSDPMGRSNDCAGAGDFDGASKILMELCEADLRCLDANSHLGNFVLGHRPKDAIRCYEVGIGSASCPSAKASIARCLGGGSTTGRSFGACTDTACASGDRSDSRKRPASSNACCGSIRRTSRVHGSSSTKCGRRRLGGKSDADERRAVPILRVRPV